MDKIFFKRKPIKCPKCGHKPVASYLYGEPRDNEELQDDINNGKIVLGGCVIMDDNPSWFCTNCETDFYKINLSL